MREQLLNSIFTVNEHTFNKVCLDVFLYQYQSCSIYSQFADSLHRTPQKIKHFTEIPFLPIEFFKHHKVISGTAEPHLTFESSGTTGSINSKRYVTDEKIYLKSFTKAFELFYGNWKDYAILALLPGYLERSNSSLVYMVKDLMQRSGHKHNAFYLNDFDLLHKTLKELETTKQKTILIGVTHALLDFAEKFPIQLSSTIIMETGGMKGKGKELLRSELHSYLCKQFGTAAIHAEYGMTELFSQAYSNGNGVFKCPPWMKVLTRDINDPLQLLENKSGGINIIDLANIDSVCFIATQDLGFCNTDSGFEILGRFDNSDVRGCNLMYVS